MCVQKESDQGLRASKVMRLLEILGYTRALTRKGMKRLHLSFFGSKTVIQKARSISFTYVLKCHIISPKGKVWNLFRFNSVS